MNKDAVFQRQRSAHVTTQIDEEEGTVVVEGIGIRQTHVKRTENHRAVHQRPSYEKEAAAAFHRVEDNADALSQHARTVKHHNRVVKVAHPDTRHESKGRGGGTVSRRRRRR